LTEPIDREHRGLGAGAIRAKPCDGSGRCPRGPDDRFYNAAMIRWADVAFGMIPCGQSVAAAWFMAQVVF